MFSVHSASCAKTLERRCARACFVSLSFAGLVVLARSLNPIPSRTRPLNSSAPMVLWLKPWESRSLPGLPRTRCSSLRVTSHTKRRSPYPGERRFVICANRRQNLQFCHDWPINAEFTAHSFPPPYCIDPQLQEQSPSLRSLHMREFIRPIAVTLSVACLSASLAVVSTNSALAQAKGGQMAPAAAPQPQAVKQIALTDKQVQGVIAAAKDMDALGEKMPKDGKPDAKLMAQFE